MASPLDVALDLEAQGAGAVAVEQAYRNALLLEPRNSHAYYSFSQFLHAGGSAGSADESEELLEKSISLDPENLAASTSLAYMLIGGSADGNGSRARLRHGLQILSNRVRHGDWPRGDTWQHPAEYLAVVPRPPIRAVHERTQFECILAPLEHAAAAMGAEAMALLPRYGVQSEGLSVPYGGWREFEVWRRCGLDRVGASARFRRDRPGSAPGSAVPRPPAALRATCSALRAVAESSNAYVHSASFSAIATGTSLRPHCGPTNGRLVMHVGLSTPRPGSARLRLGRPRALDALSDDAAERMEAPLDGEQADGERQVGVSEEKLSSLGLPTREASEIAWRQAEGFVWEDSTCHEVVWRRARRRRRRESRSEAPPKHSGSEGEGGQCMAPTPPSDVASGDAFARSEPRIVLLLLFLHPAMTREAIC